MLSMWSPLLGFSTKEIHKSEKHFVALTWVVHWGMQTWFIHDTHEITPRKPHLFIDGETEAQGGNRTYQRLHNEFKENFSSLPPSRSAWCLILW
jgi:hypothetical protein